MQDTYIALSRAVSYFHRWLAPPVFDDEDKTRIAAIFNTLILSAVAVLCGLLTAQITLGVENPRNVTVTLVICALLLSIRLIARCGQVSLAIVLFCSFWLIALSLIAYNNGTIRAMEVAGLVTCVIVPTLLIGPRTGLIFTGLTVTFVFVLARAEIAGALPSLILAALGPINQWLVFTAITLFHWILVSAASNSITEALSRTREENLVRHSAEENLRELNASLEEHVVQRTADLEKEILERKRVQEALRESEARLQAIIDNYPFHVFVKTVPDARYILVNPSWRAANHIAGDLQDQSDADLFPTMVEQLCEEDAMVIETGKPHSFERTRERPDGHPRIHLVTKFPLYNAEGAIDAIGGIAVDITERKQIEEAFRESEARYRAIFQNSGVSIWEEDFSEVKEALDKLSLQGVTDFRQYFEEHPVFVLEAMQLLKVIDVNEMTIALYGAKNKAELLASLDKILTVETLETFKEELITLAEGRIYFEGEVTDRTFRGDTLHLWRTIVFPSEKTSFKSVLVCLTNITERKRAEKALRESEERLRFVMAATQDAVYDWDIRSGQVFRNEAYQMLFSPNEPVGTDETWWENQIHPDDQPRIMESIRSTFQKRKQTWSGEYRFRRHDGTYASVIDRGYTVYNAKGQPTRMIGAIIDFTERKHAEEKLRESEERYRDLVEVCPSAILVQSEGRVVFVNPAALNLLGAAHSGHLIGKTMWEIIPLVHHTILQEPPWRIIEGHQIPPQEVKFIRQDGSLVDVEVIATPLIYQNQPAVQIIAQDITERKQAGESLREAHRKLQAQFSEIEKLQVELHKQATHDQLTGLYNRFYLFDALSQEVPRAIRGNYPISIILLDIDHFKVINDSFGHDAGDEALRVLAAQLKTLSRAEDILCRYGGDEHLIVMHRTPPHTAVERAEQLRKAIAEARVSHAGQTFEFTSSFGVAVFPDHGVTIGEVISSADQALYQSKQSGRNCVTLF